MSGRPALPRPSLWKHDELHWSRRNWIVVTWRPCDNNSKKFTDKNTIDITKEFTNSLLLNALETGFSPQIFIWVNIFHPNQIFYRSVNLRFFNTFNMWLLSWQCFYKGNKVASKYEIWYDKNNPSSQWRYGYATWLVYGSPAVHGHVHEVQFILFVPVLAFRRLRQLIYSKHSKYTLKARSSRSVCGGHAAPQTL